MHLNQDGETLRGFDARAEIGTLPACAKTYLITEPALLRPNSGEFNMGFTRDGSYFCGSGNVQRDACIAELDPETVRIVAAPAKLTERFIGANCRPSWSADGQRIAVARGADTRSLVIRSVSIGSERTLPTASTGPIEGPEWFPDGRALLIAETDYQNRRVAFRRVDVETGQDSVIFETGYGGFYGLVRIAPAGRSLSYSFRTGADQLHVLRRDLQSG